MFLCVLFKITFNCNSANTVAQFKLVLSKTFFRSTDRSCM